MSELEGKLLKPGQQFESYIIDTCIGIGGMSEVYSARHKFLQEPVAIKISRVQTERDPHLLEMAKLEAMSLSKMRHVNLVRVTDAGLTERGLVWMAMPLLEGMTLRAYMALKGALTEREALRIARDVCDGVAAAHEMRITHRDLKPENTFITTSAEVIVLDFGMAKFHDVGLTSTGKSAPGGTYRYMSPEHVEGKKVDARTDQYAVGVMLYEMLLGKHPFAEDEDGNPLNMAQLVSAHMHKLPTPLTTIMPGFRLETWEVIARAMHKDREQRFPSMVALAGALRDLAKRSPQPTAARGEVIAPRAQVAHTPKKSVTAYVSAHPVAPYATEPLLPSRRVIATPPQPPAAAAPPLAHAAPEGASTRADAAAVAASSRVQAQRTPPTSMLAASLTPGVPHAPQHISREAQPRATPLRGETPTPPPTASTNAPARRSLWRALAPMIAAVVVGGVGATGIVAAIVRNRANARGDVQAATTGASTTPSTRPLPPLQLPTAEPIPVEPPVAADDSSSSPTTPAKSAAQVNSTAAPTPVAPPVSNNAPKPPAQPAKPAPKTAVAAGAQAPKKPSRPPATPNEDIPRF